MLIALPCLRCGCWVWLAWADYLDVVASDSLHRNWPYVCRSCRSVGTSHALEDPPC
jgi:hypothetical protein